MGLVVLAADLERRPNFFLLFPLLFSFLLLENHEWVDPFRFLEAVMDCRSRQVP